MKEVKKISTSELKHRLGLKLTTEDDRRALAEFEKDLKENPDEPKTPPDSTELNDESDADPLEKTGEHAAIEELKKQGK